MLKDLLTVLLSSIGSVIVLFIYTKLIGCKQMSELNMFDYINGITIGSIAAEMATSLENDFLKPLLAMTVYTALVITITVVTNKSIRARRLFSGRSIILIDKGKIYQNNFNRAHIDMNEFLQQCRLRGYFNIADIETAIMEPNGKLSFLPKETTRPATPEDLNLKPSQERITLNVILDGEILIKNLQYTGNDKNWLMKQLDAQNVQNIKDVFLATCDSSNALSVYLKQPDAPKNDSFQ